MEPTVIPEIELPFPVRQHPEVDRIEEHTLDWAVQFQLVRSDGAAQALARARLGGLAAYAYPVAPLPEAELAADFLTCMFAADDQYEEGAYGTEQRWSAVIEAFRWALEPGQVAGPLAEAPLIRALADLSRRLDESASGTWKKRFADHVMDSMTAALTEIQLRESRTPPRFSDFTTLRRNAAGVIPCLDIIEVCAHAELPADVYYSAIYQEIFTAGADIIAWTNDLYSLNKEITCGMVSNLILVLQRERGLDREQAFSAARDLIADRVNDFLRAERRLSEWAGERGSGEAQDNLRRCATGVRDWVTGSNRWHATSTDRYYQHPPTGAAVSLIEDLLI